MIAISNACFVSLNFYGQMSPQQRAEFTALGTTYSVSKKRLIFETGAKGDNIYLLRHGRVKVMQSSTHGREVLLWFCISGELFGLSESWQEQPRLVYAKAVEPCEVISVPSKTFRTWLRGYPDLSFHMMAVLSSRLRQLGYRFLNLASGNIEAQVAKLFIDLGGCYGTRVDNNILINLPLTHQDIADMVGASRQGISSVMAAWKQRGILSSDQHFVCIENEIELIRLAGVAADRNVLPRKSNGA